MKILLIEPPFARFMGFYRYFFPFSLCSLSAYLKQQGHDLLIYDADHADKPVNMNSTDMLNVYHLYLEGIKDPGHAIWAEARKIIRDFQPEVIGITFMSTKMGAVQNLTRIAKEEYPQVPVVLGGAHPSVLYESSLRGIPADFVVIGEGEETLAELIEYLGTGRTDYNHIQGLAFIDPGGTVQATPPRPLIRELDSLPFPDRESLHLVNRYRPEDMSMIMTSRGCPYNCTFCSSLWERRTRYRSIPNIIAEIEFIRDRFQSDTIYFKDDTFTLNRKRVFAFCDALEESGLQINWECLTRIELVDEELIRRMRETGMFNLKIGIETGSQRLLKVSNKNLTLDDIKRGAEILNRLEQKWSAFFMLGFPDETAEEIAMTWKLIEEIRPTYVSMSVLAPYPGCEIYYDLEKEGAIDENTDWNLYDPFSLYANSSLVFSQDEFVDLTRRTMTFIDEYNLRSKK
jgi:radical SAM superfamily enzyme YgiQ (UPF0313 family)